MKKIQIPSGEPVGRIACPQCGNDAEFVEIADNVQVTTRYRQNTDGSFTPVDNSTEIHGEVQFVCGQCGADLTRFRGLFLEMSFKVGRTAHGRDKKSPPQGAAFPRSATNGRRIRRSR